MPSVVDGEKKREESESVLVRGIYVGRQVKHFQKVDQI